MNSKVSFHSNCFHKIYKSFYIGDSIIASSSSIQSKYKFDIHLNLSNSKLENNIETYSINYNLLESSKYLLEWTQKIHDWIKEKKNILIYADNCYKLPLLFAFCYYYKFIQNNYSKALKDFSTIYNIEESKYSKEILYWVNIHKSAKPSWIKFLTLK